MYVLKTNTPNALGIEITLDCAFKDVDDLLPYVDTNKYSAMCKLYCKNFGNKWSCPPFSPDFQTYCDQNRKVVLFVLSANLDQFGYIKQDYLKVKAANAILKSKADRITEMLFEKLECRRISSGSCRLCKPCKMKNGMKCAKPYKMAPSFEAMGMDVEQLSKAVFQHELLWYKNRVLPNYTSVVVGIATNQIVQIEELHVYLREMDFKACN